MRPPRLAPLAALSGLVAVWSPPSGAQSALLDVQRSRVATPLGKPDRWLGGAWPAVPVTPPSVPILADVRGNPWLVPVASAVLPGIGQAALGQGRSIAYVALEGFAWTQYALQLRAGREHRAEYQRLARAVARALFSDVLPVGDFEYYETMKRYVESGVFDVEPGGALDPETDTATFNGAMWLLARQTFWTDPRDPPPRESEAYARAEGFYVRRAIRPEYRWSWRNAQLEQDLFRRTIEESNSAFRLASEYLGVIIANHALSAVDAFVTIRLRRASNGPNRYGVEASLPWAPFGRPSGGRDLR